MDSTRRLDEMMMPGMPQMPPMAPPTVGAPGMNGGAPRVPMPSPPNIVRMIDQMETRRKALQDRMDADMDRWALTKYTGEGHDGEASPLAGFQTFTSNNPRTYANKAMSILSGSKTIIRVHQPGAPKQQRTLDNAKEMFALGVLRWVDERRGNLLMPQLKGSLSFQGTLRGSWAQQVLWVKEPNPDYEVQMLTAQMHAMQGEPVQPPSPTRTYPDVRDWDPRNTYWAMGAHGLEWACHKVSKTAAELVAEYGVNPAEEDGLIGDGDPWAETDARTYDAYNWFDKTVNTVILKNGHVLKPPTPHGMKVVPVTLGLVGSLPLLQAPGVDYTAHYGESIYNADRSIYDEANFMFSVMKELTHRALKQPLAWPSRDGSKLPEEDPRIAGSDVGVGIGEEPKPIPPQEMIKESGAFMGMVTSMEQRGAFPYPIYGELAFQISGYLYNLLRQGLETPIMPAVQALTTAYTQALNILCDAYMTGQFDNVTVSGRLQDTGRTWFTQEIPPEMLKQGGVLEVEIVPNLPQDDAAKVTMAETLQRSGLANRRYIQEEILKFQDPDMIDRGRLEEMAAEASPLAASYKFMMAASENGEVELAELWFIQFQIQMMMQMAQMMQGQMVLGAPAGAAPPGNGKGPMPSPAVSPPAAQGVPKPAPTPQMGPIAAPGTPRPGRNYGPGATPPMG